MTCFKTLLLATAACVTATTAHAQQTPAPAPGDDAVTSGADTPQPSAGGDIVVTGSRIARETYDTPAPVVGVSNEELLESGTVELSETLADLPALTSPQNDASVTGNTQNSGLSSIQLRNLGTNRTLVLIDGRRTVSNSGISNLVSLSTIPNDFINRVEIITGGTSSVYGSDAIAGVVNVITENRLQGVRANLRSGITEQGDGQEFTANLTMGTRFAGRRGYALLSATYDWDGGIRALDREFATRPVAYRYNFNTGRNEFATVARNAEGRQVGGFRPADEVPEDERVSLSAFTPGGSFSGASSARTRFYVGNQLVPLGPDPVTGRPVTGTGAQLNSVGNSGYFISNRDGFNQRTGRSLILERDRYLLAGKVNYDFSDTLSAFAQVQYSRIDSGETREAVGIGWDSTYPITDPVTGQTVERVYGRIPCLRGGPCNPFVPPALSGSEVPSTGVGISWDRRFDEVGGQITENRRDTLRSWVGLRGQLPGNWNWEASFGYGQYDQEQVRRNEINALNLIQGLNVQLGPDGQPRCVDAAARAAGCVPVNLFGAGSISAAAADWIRADLRQDLTIRQYTGQAFVTGELFDLPGGPLGVAFGADYRRDEQELVGDLLSQSGGTTGNAIPNFAGSIQAVEGYAEFSAPLLRDRPGIALLSVDASARVAHYDIDNVGTVFSWRAGAQYAPVADLRFRAQYALAQRAPDIAELFSPPRGNFEVATDLCSGVTPTSTGRVAEGCRQDAGIQALFAAQAAAGQTQVFNQTGNSLYSPNGGNPDLKEETAHTFTAGGVFAPRFLPDFTLAVDYYDIRIRDAIDAYSNLDIQIQCYDTDVPQAGNPFCADVTRNPVNGQIVQLVQRQQNLARFDTRGIDVAANWRFDVPGIPGRFDLRYDGTHVLRQEVSFEGVNGTVVNDLAGDLAEGSFKFRARGTIGWRFEDFRIRWTAKYFGQISDSNVLRGRYEALLATNPGAEYPLFLDIGDVWEHDLFLSFDIGRRNKGFRLTAGVNNIFDKVSPFLPSGTESGRLTNQNGVYDVAGRRFFVGASARF